MTFDEQTEAQIRAIIDPKDPFWPNGAGEDLVKAFSLMMAAAREDEREACAKLSEEYGKAREKHETKTLGRTADRQSVFDAANSIAALIRGRGER